MRIVFVFLFLFGVTAMAQDMPNVQYSNPIGILDGRHFIFDPKPDITAYELALILPMAMGRSGSFPRIFDSLPPEAQRHFKVTK